VTQSDDIILSPRPNEPSGTRLLWTRPAYLVPAASRRAVATVLIVVGALATAWSGVVHLKLWNQHNGYRQLAVVGNMFLLQGIACLVLALAVVVLRRLVVVLLAAVLMAASIGGLVISLRRTLFGYHEYGDAPYVGASLVVESVAVVAFVAAAIVAVTAARRAH
jgi:hypothetical protein